MSHMQQEEFEKRIKAQLDDASLSPAPDAWDKLEQLLPPEKKKRRGGLWLWSLMGAVLIISYFAFRPQHATVQHPRFQSENQSSQNNLSSKGANNIPSPVQVPEVKSNQTAIPSISLRPNTTINALSPALTISASAQHETYIYNSLKEKQIHPIPINSIHPKNYTGAFFPGLPIPDDDSSNAFNPDDSDTRFMVGAAAFITWTYRHLRTMGNASALEQSQVKLRNQIERINIDFNGGLFFKMKVYKNWYAGTGIYIYNCSERVNFAFKQNIPDKPVPAIAMNDLYLKNNINNPMVFKLQGDSIYHGNPTTDNMNTMVNQYYYNEIPLTLTWFKANKKYNWFAEGGLSFAELTVINASVVELDQIGFTGITDRVNYTGISSWIINTGASAGFGVNLNRNFHIDLSAEFKYAVTPLINFGYARQNPYAFGGGIVFARRF